MKKQSRRGILQAAMGAVLAGALPCVSCARPKVEGQLEALVAECLKMYEAWSRCSPLEPEVFLQLSGSLGAGSQAFMARVQSDFAQGRIEVYEGFVISQTEFAVWARIGKNALT